MRITRLGDGPIAGPDSHPSIGTNIQGPSVIRVPEWAPDPLGRFLMYFADHQGSFIRLAYSDDVAGPWTVHPPGALGLAESGFPTELPDLTDDALDRIGALYADMFGDDARAFAELIAATPPHVASPDVHVDDERQRFVMYFHGLESLGVQVTRAAMSADGVTFEGRSEILGNPYLRAFAHGGMTYALTMPGTFTRSADGLTGFEQGPTLFEPAMRHSAVALRGETLHVLWTRAGDAPESILHSTVDVRDDWNGWRASEPEVVLRPERDWEGADAPIEPSVRGAVYGHVNQLRDPALFDDGGRTYLFYAVAGESGIAVAEVHWDD